MRAIFASLIALTLSACAPEVALRFAPEAAAIGETQKVFFSTTRKDNGQGDAYSEERSFSSRFGRLDISIPPNREVGSLPLPPAHGEVDPSKQLLAVSAQSYSSNEFRAAIAAELKRQKPGNREAVIFVHGFNNSFASSLYRFAQLSYDLKISGVQVQYSWPSRNSVLGYAYDRDSVLFARDGLEELIEQLMGAGINRIILVAHSMGSQLTMETLRQMSLKGKKNTLNKIGGVVLMSPDIDVTVFRSQAQSMGKLPQPFIVLASPKDKALSISSIVSGDSTRLGNLTEVSELAGLEVMLIDVGAFSVGDGHFNAATSPALIGLLGRVGDIDTALNRDARSRVGLLPGAVLTVQGATQVILSPGLR